MKTVYKRLILVFLLLAILKTILSFLIPSPTMFADEYFYSSMARSFLKDGNFIIFGSPSTQYPPLYPLILSFAYVFKDMRIIYMVFKIINALLSSLIIFPVWLLAKEFLSERKASLVAILCGIWPAGFIFSFFVMAEGLFYVLVLFTIYFVYKSFTKNNIKWDLLAGLALGLTYLTKVLGVALVFVILMVLLTHLITKRDLSQIKRKLFLYGVAFLTVLPWLIRNGLIFGWNLSGIMGYAKVLSDVNTNFSFSIMGYWILMYLSYLLLATGVIIFVFNLLSIKSCNNKLKEFSIISCITVLSFIIISAILASRFPHKIDWLVGRPMGRYVESSIPLMIILGFANLKFKENFYKHKLKYILICSLLIIATFKLFSFKLFPVNAISLSYIGMINLGVQYLADNFRILIMTTIFALLPFGLLLIKHINFKKLLYLMVLFFITVNIIAFGMIYYNSNYRWHPLDQMQLGLWFNDNIDSPDVKVLLDERGDNIDRKETYEGDMSYSLKKVERPMRRIAFWMNAYVEVDNIERAKEYDYVISKYDLDYTLIKYIGEVKLYKILK